MKKDNRDLKSIDIAIFLDDLPNAEKYEIKDDKVYFSGLHIFDIDEIKSKGKKGFEYVLSLAPDFEKFIKGQIKSKKKSKKKK